MTWRIALGEFRRFTSRPFCFWLLQGLLPKRSLPTLRPYLVCPDLAAETPRETSRRYLGSCHEAKQWTKAHERERACEMQTGNGRFVRCGPNQIKAKPIEKLLTCLDEHGVALAPGRIIHAPTPSRDPNYSLRSLPS
jgi:hypothetical protein